MITSMDIGVENLRNVVRRLDCTVNDEFYVYVNV
jgi:hypothetical protein